MSKVLLLRAGAAAVLLSTCALAWSGEATLSDGAHAHHGIGIDAPTRHVASYQIPNVRLVREDGKVVALGDELGDGRPVVMAFIYTTCTSVCPLTSQTLAEVQRRLGAERDRVHLASITIDPDQDTPARLREYAQKFHAGPEWHHYTGTLAASQTVQRAFGLFRGDKMSHSPAILVRALPGGDWVRIDGFPTADQVLAELPQAQAAR